VSVRPHDSGELPRDEDKSTYVRAMFDAIAPRYDLVNRVMTLGLDRGWRRRAIDELGLPPQATVLDLGCGTGDLSREAARRGLRPLGVDLSFAMLDAAPGPSGSLVEADAERLPLADEVVDGVVSGFALRNFAHQEFVFAEIARVLRPGGRLSILEVDTPTNPVLRFGDHVWFTQVVPRIGALLSVASAYRYLPRSLAYLPSAEALEAMLNAAGFHDIRRLACAGGIAQIVTATRRNSGLPDSGTDGSTA
jgi:demethylmenaquinone methyltransferase/2-methoxy-6-polyprenyl-1,4-benzoquinol methylase